MLCSLWFTLSFSVVIFERLRFLINFSNFLSWVFWRLVLVTLDLVMKIACFAQIGPFLNFFSFPSNFCNYSLSSSIHPFPKHTMHSTKNSIVDHLSKLILQEKGMGFIFLTLFYMYMSLFLHFVRLCWVCVFCNYSNMGLFKMLDLVVWG